MNDDPRFGKTKFATIRRDFGKLRTAIRAHDSFAAEAAWEKCERWMEALPTKEQAAHIAAQDAKIAKLVEALRPFSKEAGWWFSKNYSADDIPVEAFDDYDSVMTVGDLFNARQALASIGETDD